MWTAEAVLVCALTMLGRAQSSLPPIELVSQVPLGVSAGVEAYVPRDDRRIHLVTTSATFREAQASSNQCGAVMAIRKIASVLIHEEVHIRQGAGEKAAYEAQLTILTALGAGPGSPPYSAVKKAMLYTLKQQRQNAARLMAAAQP
jgi:hypothetical protein